MIEVEGLTDRFGVITRMEAVIRGTTEIIEEGRPLRRSYWGLTPSKGRILMSCSKRLWTARLALVALVVALAVAAAACGGEEEAVTTAPATETVAPPATETTAAGGQLQQPGQCGTPEGQGQPATGDPIKIGAIVIDVPGAVWSPITNLTKAYFDCVNDNGGINGQPVEYTVVNDQGDGNASHQAAIELWEAEQVLGFAGSASFVECTVNHEYYEQNGIYPIVAGGSAECFNTPNIAAVNQGPFYSVASAAWFALEQRGAKKIVCIRSNIPGAEFECIGAKVLAGVRGFEFVEMPVDSPIADPASLVLRAAQEAGEDGGVLVGISEDQLLPILQAVEQQGLIDKAIWFSGATGSTSTVMQAISDEWDGKWFAQSEFAVPETAQGPDMVLYRSVIGQYAPSEPFGNFGEMGFLAGRFMTEAMLNVVAAGEELTQASVNAAVKNLVNLQTDVLCKPWYFGDLKSHLPNNGSLATTRDAGKAVPLIDECFPNPVTDPIIAQAYLDELTLGITPLPGTPSQAELEEFLAQAAAG